MKPEKIEKLSFKIIEEEAGPHNFTENQWKIVRRMIHTTADFEYLENVRFHPEAVEKGIWAVKNGKTIITDTNMALAGIRKYDLVSCKCKAKCLINDPEVIRISKENDITRAHAAVDYTADIINEGIYVIGNAPTALLRLVDLVKQNSVKPALVIGLPVGFVNAAESKQALLQLDIPYITNIGRKGGSNVAASVINAIIIMAEC